MNILPKSSQARKKPPHNGITSITNQHQRCHKHNEIRLKSSRENYIATTTIKAVPDCLHIAVKNIAYRILLVWYLTLKISFFCNLLFQSNLEEIYGNHISKRAENLECSPFLLPSTFRHFCSCKQMSAKYTIQTEAMVLLPTGLGNPHSLSIESDT